MGKSELSLQEARDMFTRVCDEMVASKDLLTQADKAIGDGDHGVGMARGFEAVRQKIADHAFGTIDELLKTVGMILLTSIGGASGAVFGTLFRGGAKNLGGKTVFDSAVLSLLLADGLQAVQQRGGAKPGDKTMVDALTPAAARARELAAAPITESLAAIAEAARQGMEKTKDMIATIGKAKTLGERARGHADPGAVSVYLILKSMSESVVAQNENRAD